MKSFKSPKFNLAAGTVALALLLSPAVGWSTRVTGGTVVSGEVTAAPSSSEIEVEHRSYHIRAESAAQKAALKFSVGDKVDLVLTGAAGDSSSQVVAIAAHAEPAQPAS
jgi:hypothetical protein